jgi:Kdo2-lipid IVA lauroyltransferase/acyltransferase
VWPRFSKRLVRRSTVRLLEMWVRWQGRAGMQAVQRAGGRLGELHYRLRFVQRRRLSAQLGRVLALPTDDDSTAILRDAYRINDRAALEIVAASCGVVTAEEVAASAAVQGVEQLHERLRTGQGAILLGMHMGNGVAFVVHLAQLGLPVSVVAYQSRKLSPAFFERVFASSAVEVIPARPSASALRRMMRALQHGAAVFVLMDQGDKVAGVPTRFLGKDIRMPVGPAAIAKRLGVPVYPVLPIAAAPQWTFRIGMPVSLDPDTPIDVDVQSLTTLMEEHIRRFPRLWAWHHRRWQRSAFADAD